MVKDIFEKNIASEYIEEYIVSEEDKQYVNIDEQGTLIWTVGTIGAKETRSLTYKVKLKEDYKNLCFSQANDHDNTKLVNTAQVYVNETGRDTANATFVPKSEGKVWKHTGKFKPNENGGGTITYMVRVEAPETNNITLDNVTIKDALDGSFDDGYSTNIKYRQYIRYDEDSFKLYEGSCDKEENIKNLIEITPGGTLKFPKTEEKHNTSFEYTIGSMKPGDKKTLIYKIEIEPGVYVEAGNNDIKITNRAYLYAGGDEFDKGKLNQSTTDATISKKMWSRKIAGEKTESNITVVMSGEDNQYVYNEGSLSEKTNKVDNFTVSEGSYKYQIVANEAGDWDLSSAVMEDAFKKGYMQYIGYVRVDAYEIAEGQGIGSEKTDTEVIADFNSKTLKKTVWIEVNGKNTFQFKPENIGMSGKYAYLLTYYAKPQGLENVTTVVVTNVFKISGTVGIKEKSYDKAGIEVNAKVNVEGGNHFSVNKQFWYYDKTGVSEDATADGYKNGALYWIIEVDGNTIPVGTEIKDQPTGEHNTQLYGAGEKQFIGVYQGESNFNFKDKTIASLNSAGSDFTKEELKVYPYNNESGYKTESIDEKFKCWNEGSQICFKFNKEVTLTENQSLYFIISTSPNAMPEKDRDSKTFANTAYSKDPTSNDWISHNQASYTIYGNDGIFKEVGKVFTYDGKDFETLKGGDNNAAGASHWNEGIKKPGTYVAWQIQINHFGTLSGNYRIKEIIPEGMELVYIKHFWNLPSANGWTSPEITDLGSDWQHTSNTTSNGINYYTKGQEAIWQINGLKNGGQKDNYAIEFQIVCRVTDPNVLLGGSEKAFENKVVLYSEAGSELDDHTSSVSVTRNTMKKEGTYTNKNGGRYPFKITINDLGEDLLNKTDKIKVVDKMCDILTVDPATIEVKNTKTGAPVEGWTPSVDGKTLTITVPDDLPLTITYEAKVNAAPGDKITISNNAYWEGYENSGGSGVKVENFSYSVGGSVGAASTPTVKVTKLDQNDVQKYLPNAKFTLTKVEWREDKFQPVVSDSSNTVDVLTGSTGEDGTLLFGTGTEEEKLEYNTVYCLQEIEAPEGYILDATPHYFAVAKKVQTEGAEESQYPSELNIWEDKGVDIYYMDSQYEYSAYNCKSEISVVKKFQNASGDLIDQVAGTYIFGLYDKEITVKDLNSDNLPECIQTVSINFAKDAEEPELGTATFKNVDVDKTYYIYEHDDAGKPILNANKAADINGKAFRVIYENGSKVTIDKNGKVSVGDEDAGTDTPSKVTVINRVNGVGFPRTGGIGVMPFRVGGTLLILLALSLYLYTRRSEKCRRMK